MRSMRGAGLPIIPFGNLTVLNLGVVFSIADLTSFEVEFLPMCVEILKHHFRKGKRRSYNIAGFLSEIQVQPENFYQ